MLFYNNNTTFPTSNCKNYMEWHHIIPVSRKESFSQDLDIVENMLYLFQTYHRKIHFATNEVKQQPILEEIINKTKNCFVF